MANRDLLSQMGEREHCNWESRWKLFILNDLDPKASFKIMGQQIDGAFTLDGTEFLFEAKWTKSLINSSDLAVFKEK